MALLSNGILQGFLSYGWQPDATLSDDTNWMDLVLIITRSSQLKQGSMACILVRPRNPSWTNRVDENFDAGDCSYGSTEARVTTATQQEHVDGEGDSSSIEYSRAFLDQLIIIATNQSIYEPPGNSDLHAEVAALATAAKLGRSTQGCTAYITMPPCRRCFAALAVAGIHRIVSRYDCRCVVVSQAAVGRHIDLVVYDDTMSSSLSSSSNQLSQKQRIDRLIQRFIEEQETD